MKVNEEPNFSFDLNDEENFTFSEELFLKKKKENKSSLYKYIIPINTKVEIKNKHIIRIPLCNLNSNNKTIDNQKVNLINKKIVEIENELNNILLDSDSEKKIENGVEIEFNNNKSVLFSFETFCSENKLLIQESFDLLDYIIKNLSKELSSINEKQKKKNEKTKNMFIGINEQIKALIKIIEKIKVYLNDYDIQIYSAFKLFSKIKNINKLKNNSKKMYSSLKNNLDKESKFYQDNYLYLTKIKKFISYLCYKIINNSQNQQELNKLVYILYKSCNS